MVALRSHEAKSIWSSGIRRYPDQYKWPADQKYVDSSDIHGVYTYDDTYYIAWCLDVDQVKTILSREATIYFFDLHSQCDTDVSLFLGLCIYVNW